MITKASKKGYIGQATLDDPMESHTVHTLTYMGVFTPHTTKNGTKHTLGGFQQRWWIGWKVTEASTV